MAAIPEPSTGDAQDEEIRRLIDNSLQKWESEAPDVGGHHVAYTCRFLAHEPGRRHHWKFEMAAEIENVGRTCVTQSVRASNARQRGHIALPLKLSQQMRGVQAAAAAADTDAVEESNNAIADLVRNSIAGWRSQCPLHKGFQLQYDCKVKNKLFNRDTVRPFWDYEAIEESDGRLGKLYKSLPTLCGEASLNDALGGSSHLPRLDLRVPRNSSKLF